MAKTSGKKLRTGFTTGTAAAAAAKGALIYLLEQKSPENVTIMLLTEQPITIGIHSCSRVSADSARCSVIKDAGDDPDVTRKAEIGASVTLVDDTAAGRPPFDVRITGGEGVGRVTKPGLDVPPGEPAINPGPRKMITRAVTEVLKAHALERAADVEVFVPQGQILARKTLNARLGILDGISILGTTGIVKPMSHEAYVATIQSSISVARAMGVHRLVLTTGRRSERYAQNVFDSLQEEAFIQIGDYFKVSLEMASTAGFRQITLAIFFGKAVKMAQGAAHTHAAKSRLALNRLAGWALETTGDGEFAKLIRQANTARQAFEMICGRYPAVIPQVGRRIVTAAAKFCGRGSHVQCVIFDYSGQIVFNSD
jgi:cobalt-precorrin-5B (C1)-methyltransferase